MNLLLVSPLWAGIRQFFLVDDPPVSGMPAFYHVLIELLQDPRIDELHLILLLGKADQANVPSRYKNKLFLYPVVYREGVGRVLSFLAILWAGIKIIRATTVHRYLGFGSISFVTWFFRIYSDAPDQRRLFGVSTVSEDIGRFSLFILFKHPYNYLAIRLPCRTLFITDDGSHGDRVFEKLGAGGTQFYFLKNGVTKPERLCVPAKNETVLFVGRVYPWKGQRILVEAFAQLKRKYAFKPEVAIVGEVQDQTYYCEMKELIEAEGLDNIRFTGSLPESEVIKMMQEARLGAAFYQTSNLGNVLIESMAIGLPVVTRNVNSSLSSIPDDCYISITSYDVDQVSEAIYTSYYDTRLLASISLAAVEYVKNELMDWRERTEIEIEAILV